MGSAVAQPLSGLTHGPCSADPGFGNPRSDATIPSGLTSITAREKPGWRSVPRGLADMRFENRGSTVRSLAFYSFYSLYSTETDSRTGELDDCGLTSVALYWIQRASPDKSASGVPDSL